MASVMAREIRMKHRAYIRYVQQLWVAQRMHHMLGGGGEVDAVGNPNARLEESVAWPVYLKNFSSEMDDILHRWIPNTNV